MKEHFLRFALGFSVLISSAFLLTGVLLLAAKFPCIGFISAISLVGFLVSYGIGMECIK